MKLQILSVLIALNFAAAEPVSDEAKVLRAIDNICGDTWCEGDFQFKFTNLSFNTEQNTTLVSFTMSPYWEDAEAVSTEGFAAAIKAPRFDVECTVKGFSDAAVILEEHGTLDWTFYTQMSDCVSALEARLNSLFVPQ